MQVLWALVLECGDVVSGQQGCFFFLECLLTPFLQGMDEG